MRTEIDKERYANPIDRIQWWGRQMVTYGTDVHVGLDTHVKLCQSPMA